MCTFHGNKMGSFLSPKLLVHLAGVVAVSQLILTLSTRYQQDFYDNLNTNATGVFHEVLDRLADVLSTLLPVGDGMVGLGTLLQTLIYSAASLYVFYLARLVFKLSVVDGLVLIKLRHG